MNNAEIKVGDVVWAPFPAQAEWEEWEREGRVIIVAEPYCTVVVEVDPFHTERVTCKISSVKKKVNP